MAIGSVTISGMASGLPADIVDQLLAAQQTRLKALKRDKEFFTGQQTTIGDLESKMLALSTKAKELQEASAWSPHSVTSSDSDRVAATADSTAMAANHAIIVGQLATYDTTAMSAASGKSDPTVDMGEAGSFDFTYNGTAFSVASMAGYSLNDLASAINGIDYGSESGVNASVLFDGSVSRLVLTAKDSGTYKPSGAGSDTDRIAITNSPFTFGQTTAPKDAVLKIDGIEVTSTKNQVTDALTGVTLNLKSVTSGTVFDADTQKITSDGSAINVTIANDETALKTTLNGFVDSYNAILDYVNQNKTGSLSGDSLSRSLVSQLRGVLNTPTGSASSTALTPFSTLAELGLRTDQKSGKISFNSSSLDSALASDFNNVSRLFTSKHATSSDTFTEGVAHRMADLITSLTSSTGGAVTGKKDGLLARINRLDKDIERENSRLEKVKERLTTKFSNLEQMITKMNSAGSSLTNALKSK
ncbi:MAG: flagellar filament capping protein FliD [Magnetococcales bacterium]|nr:flagellar filament capping protein FliD [Magnetococcales bacterium]